MDTQNIGTAVMKWPRRESVSININGALKKLCTKSRGRLHHPEGDQEGERDTARRKAELLLGEQGQNRAFQPYHRTHEGVDENQEPELVPVRRQPEFDGARWSAGWTGRWSGR